MNSIALVNFTQSLIVHFAVRATVRPHFTLAEEYKYIHTTPSIFVLVLKRIRQNERSFAFYSVKFTNFEYKLVKLKGVAIFIFFTFSNKCARKLIFRNRKKRLWKYWNESRFLLVSLVENSITEFVRRKVRAL